MKSVFANVSLCVTLLVGIAPSYAAPVLPTPSGVSVPEIDAGGVALALALLGGIVAIARERRKG